MNTTFLKLLLQLQDITFQISKNFYQTHITSSKALISVLDFHKNHLALHRIPKDLDTKNMDSRPRSDLNNS